MRAYPPVSRVVTTCGSPRWGVVEKRQRARSNRGADAGLERRVTERTWELEKANEELRASLAEVKVLSGLLPICPYYKKIRDGDQYWQSVEAYLSQHTEAKFTHGCCPSCLEKQMANLDRIFPESAKSPS